MDANVNWNRVGQDFNSSLHFISYDDNYSSERAL